MFSIPHLDNLTESQINEYIRDWIGTETPALTDPQTLDQVFNYSLPRTLFLKNLPLNSVVMDVGAGEGSLINYKGWPFFDRSDLEIHALSLEKGRYFDRYNSYEIKNFETEPDIFPGRIFDAMVCCHFLEHMHDLSSTIKFFANRIRTAGRLYLEWPHPITKIFPASRSMLDLGAHITTLNFFDDHTHVEAWPGNDVALLLQDAGFAIEATGRVHLPWLGDQLKSHALKNQDLTRMTVGTWAAMGWSQYLIASRN